MPGTKLFENTTNSMWIFPFQKVSQARKLIFQELMNIKMLVKVFTKESYFK